jgi:hypothetical protein
LQAFLDRDIPALHNHAFGLLGLGAGLTPEGDDVLCGFLCGLTVLGQPCAITTALRDFVDEHAPRRTTALSRTLLHYAGRGVAIEPLLDVLCSLECGVQPAGPVRVWPAVDSQPIVDRLLAVGHSSGLAMLTGACLAAAAVYGVPVFRGELRGSTMARSAEYLP